MQYRSRPQIAPTIAPEGQPLRRAQAGLVTRVIARMELKSDRVIKGIRMEGLRKLGTPADFAYRYFEQGADELMLEDIVASLYDREFDPAKISEVARLAPLPLTFCGRIRHPQDAVFALRSGADKVGVNSGALIRPDLIDDLAHSIGSQSVVGIIQAKQMPGGSWEPLWLSGRERSRRDVCEWVEEIQARGVGEVGLFSVDRDGMGATPDFDLIKQVRRLTKVPLIAGSGIVSIDDVLRLVFDIGVDAVVVAHAFHFGKLTVMQIKEALDKRGAAVRPAGAAS